MKADAGIDDDPALRARDRARDRRVRRPDARVDRRRAGAARALYGADVGRIEIVPPGVDHEIFRPVAARRGPRRAPRSASATGPLLLFVGPDPAAQGRRPRGPAARRARRPGGGARSSSAARAVPTARPSWPGCTRLVDELGRPRPGALRPAAAARRPRPLLPRRRRLPRARATASRSGWSRSRRRRAARRWSAANVGGLRSLVDDGVTGYLVDSRDPGDYAAPIARLLADPELRAAMGANAEAALAPVRVEHDRGPAPPAVRRSARARAGLVSLTPGRRRMLAAAHDADRRAPQRPGAAEQPRSSTSSTTPSCAAGTCASAATAATRRRSTSTSTSARCATSCTSCPRPTTRPACAALHAWLLRRNHDLYGARFSLGPDGDVYLTGRVALEHLTEQELDRIIGVLYELTERWFQAAVTIAYGPRGGAPDPT